MNAPNPLITGIAPEHVPAVIAVLCLPLIVWLALGLLRAFARDGRDWKATYETTPLTSRLTAALLLVTAAVHLALPLGHDGPPSMGLLFFGSGVAFTALAVRVFTGRWRLAAVFVLTASIIAYLVVTGSGQEEPDQVGIATKLVELAALGLVIRSAAPGRGFVRRLARPAASGALVLLTVITGAVIWIGSFAAHAKADAAEAAVHAHTSVDAQHIHSHSHAARAQAGIIMRPSRFGAPTPEQTLAAARLVKETKAGIARYRDYRAAIADGYKADGALKGFEVHFSKDAHGKDGRILDHKRPEQLVYAFDKGRYVLLGAVYLMERAGRAGPEIGGSITRWHAHNICFTFLPPGFTLVSPFGTCPTASISVTLPEMLHVWTVDNPGGPYADGLDEKYVRSLVERGRRM